MKWWLIDEETVEKVRTALEEAIEITDWMHEMNDTLRDALHHLDANLNSTDAVPDDFREEQ